MTLASWYGPGFVGQPTASGEIYHRGDLTAASRSLPLGTRVQVTNLNTGRAVVVRINDRGPYVRGRGIDLSQGAAERIGLNHSGVARVSVTRLDATASASSMPTVSQEWSGKARVSPYTPRQYRRTSHYTHHYTHHYQYASASTYHSSQAYHSSHRMVANPVGVHVEMIRHGENGFLATTPAEWGQAIGALVHDAALRRRMGRAGRLRVERDSIRSFL